MESSVATMESSGASVESSVATAVYSGGYSATAVYSGVQWPQWSQRGGIVASVESTGWYSGHSGVTVGITAVGTTRTRTTGYY